MPRFIKSREFSDAGRRLWRWVARNYATSGCEPLVREICILADRLTQIREALAAPDLKSADRGRLINAEIKVVGQYTRMWRLLGLADPEVKKPCRN